MPVDRSAVAAVGQITDPGTCPGGGTDLAVARRVMRAEIDGLAALSEALDTRFEEVVDTCAAAQGRVIVTGIGKSGHVARKIAATLASTGTPAQFVHPVEASHGDLGMIGSDDAILALSNSGETVNLPILSLIPVTSRSRSSPSPEVRDPRLLMPPTA